jgi:hypothetical protein
MRSIPWVPAWCLATAAFALVSLSSGSSTTAGEIAWTRIEIDPAFRSEGATAFDVNKDGKLDFVTGEVWYEAPDWTMHEIRPTKAYDGATGYSNSFACFAQDVNADGWTDLICIGFPGVPCHWFENPQNKEGHWKQSEIWHSAAGESPQFLDVTGDGKPELVMSSETEGMFGYLEVPPPEKCYDKWTFTAVSEQKLPGGITHRYYHGLGVGDLNSDGKQDIVIPHGWWEQPATPRATPWTFHPHKLAKKEGEEPQAGADIHVDDLDLDGDADLLMTSAHLVGVWWFENVGTKAEPKFIPHTIDTSFSQTHALHYRDINGDGTPDLITGKRFYAHGPKGDIDPMAEVVMFWYELKKTKGAAPTFTPHKIQEGSGTGVGTQFSVLDMNGDGKLDLVLSNKKGANLLLQK